MILKNFRLERSVAPFDSESAKRTFRHLYSASGRGTESVLYLNRGAAIQDEKPAIKLGGIPSRMDGILLTKKASFQYYSAHILRRLELMQISRFKLEVLFFRKNDSSGHGP